MNSTIEQLTVFTFCDNVKYGITTDEQLATYLLCEGYGCNAYSWENYMYCDNDLVGFIFSYFRITSDDGLVYVFKLD